MRTHSQIIDAHGGPAKFGEAIGARRQTVQMWKYRKCIPRVNWPEVMLAFEDVALEELRAGEPVKPSQRAA